MTSSLEFEGKNPEEALARAAAALNIPAENLKFTLLSMGSKGFLGLGRKKARIRVETTALAHDGTEGEQAAAAVKENKTPKAPKAEKPGDKKSRGREAAPKMDAALTLGEVPPPVTLPAPGEKVYEGSPDERMLMACEVLKNILDKMGFSSEVKLSRIDRRIILSVASPDSAMLIGRRGNTLEALQFMVNKIMARRLGPAVLENRETGSDEPPRFVVDVADYRQRRHSYLMDNTLSLAREVLKNGRSQSLSHLTAAERRLIHLALKPIRELSTSSAGQGPVRDLVIKKKHR